jgi:hypothetical protein
MPKQVNRNVVHKGQRLGQPAKGRNAGHVGQYGIKQGDHITHPTNNQLNYRGEPRFTSPPFNAGQQLGNANAASMAGRGGPGAGRKIYGQAGTQGQHGPANPGNAPAKNHDILND